jgi:imidazolonepropionase-like amidohydrolase
MDDKSTVPILFKNGVLIDGSGPDPIGVFNVLIQGQTIAEVSDQPISVNSAIEIDLNGRSIMPGLIDCHAHPTLTDMKLDRLEDVPLTLLAARASVILREMLDRGFTTVRDAAGGDWGLKEALARGYLSGPRLFISGRALTQTGGHGDFRKRTDDHIPCGCSNALHMVSRMADGVDQVLHAVREEMRKGADQIKVMVSGGVASPNDPLASCQYSHEELTAMVKEATRWGTYVLAHAYTPEAITHALSCGVRTIEHANLIDAAAARMAREKGAYVVPTLVTYDALDKHGAELGLTPVMLDKLALVRKAGLNSLELCQQEGVPMGFGTDLLGQAHQYQSREFQIRCEVQKPYEVINSATRIGAEILCQQGKLGVIAAGATADLLVIDGNPLENIELLQGHNMPIIMQDGRFHKNEL